MVCWSVLPEGFGKLAETATRRVTLSFLHAYASDWKDLCTKNKEKGGEKNGPKTEAKKPVEFPKSMFSENPLTGSVDRNK